MYGLNTQNMINLKKCRFKLQQRIAPWTFYCPCLKLSIVVHKFYPQNPLHCDPWWMSLWALSPCCFFYLPSSHMNTLSATRTWGSPFFVFPRTTLRHNLQPRELLIRSVPYRSFTSFGHEKLLSILWFSGSIHRILFPIETLSFIPSQSCVNSFVGVHMRFLLPVELSLSALSSGSFLLHCWWFLWAEIRLLHHIDHRPLFDFSDPYRESWTGFVTFTSQNFLLFYP